MKFKTLIPNCFAYHLFLLLITTSILHFVQSKDHYPNAHVYESASKGKTTAAYADEPYKWSNMRKVLKSNGMKKLGTLCVTGTFLLYGKLGYQAGSDKQIRLLSGIDVCTPPGMALSIQLVSPVANSVHDPSLVLFPEKILRGAAYAVSGTSIDLESKFGLKVQSLMINGDKLYTAFTSNGNRYCIKPKEGSTKDSICMLHDVAESKIGNDNRWKGILMGCSDKDLTASVTVDNCLKFGSGKLEEIHYKKKNDKKKLKSASTNWGGFKSPITDCNNNELLTLFAFTQFNDFSSEYQMHFPKNKNLTWMTELLDSTFDVFLATCPESVVHTDFLQTLRELYIYFAQNVWAEGKPKKLTNVTKNYYTKLTRMTDDCLDIISDASAEGLYYQAPMDIFSAMQTPGYKPENFLPEFAVTPETLSVSLVMETVWRVYNHVAAICHVSYEYQDNFWPDYSLMFHDMYLEPMIKHWGAPGITQDYYQVLFGGYSIAQELQGISVCVSTVFKSLPRLEVLPRPNGIPQFPSTKKTVPKFVQ